MVSRSWKVILYLLLATAPLALFVYLRWKIAEQNISKEVAAQSTVPQNRLSEVKAASRNLYNSPKLALAAPMPIGQTPRTFTVASLPAFDQPLSHISENLIKESDAGNYLASCRLAEELFRCELFLSGVEKNDKLIETLKDQLNAMQPGNAEYLNLAKSIQYFAEQKEVETRVCKGFENQGKLEPWRYQFRAALAGHVSSMAAFATAPPLNPLDFINNAEAWVAYKEYAPQFLQAAANSGSRAAVWRLAEAYAGIPMFQTGGLSDDEIDKGFNPGGIKLAEVDYFKSAVYTYISAAFPESKKYFFGGAKHLFKLLNKKLPPEQLAAAKIQADALIASWPPDAQAQLQKKPESSYSGRKSYIERVCQ